MVPSMIRSRFVLPFQICPLLTAVALCSDLTADQGVDYRPRHRPRDGLIGDTRPCRPTCLALNSKSSVFFRSDLGTVSLSTFQYGLTHAAPRFQSVSGEYWLQWWIVGHTRPSVSTITLPRARLRDDPDHDHVGRERLCVLRHEAMAPVCETGHRHAASQ